eukprot:TRINITY_DN18814_c0_g1_i1.p1 TRINITY_DN18814_c0_g1~~TRINITY_DN18814_c0_g1_i1.p1  ORF type:complete len:166 (-),score=33.35 TRINITY_DN18814_c0_g1_i1:68-565(-)
MPSRQIKCRVGAGNGSDLPVGVVVGGQLATPPYSSFFFWNATAVVVNYASQPSTAGGIITITGSGFENNSSAISVSVQLPSLSSGTTATNNNVMICSSVTIESSSTSFTCMMPPGLGGALLPILVIVGDRQNTLDQNTAFSYRSPIIRSISKVGTKGGMITIQGD